MPTKREKTTIISFLPGQRMTITKGEVERSVVLDTKGADSFILPDHAFAYHRSSRIGIPKVPTPCAYRFEGDGEGVDLFYGPAQDFREEVVEAPDEEDEEAEADYQQEVAKLRTRSLRHLDSLKEDEELEALRKADEPAPTAKTFGWSALMWFAVAAAFVYVFMASDLDTSSFIPGSSAPEVEVPASTF